MMHDMRTASLVEEHVVARSEGAVGMLGHVSGGGAGGAGGGGGVQKPHPPQCVAKKLMEGVHVCVLHQTEHAGPA